MAKKSAKPDASLPPPPAHLSEKARGWWGRIVREYGIADEAGLLLLEGAMSAFDRAAEARAILEAQGLTVVDKYGQHRPHPAVGIERDALKNHLAYLRAMNLDVEPLRDKPGRPPGRGY